ncbi:MAG: TrkA family potassium uptake protein, partial [Fusobacteria bacterium]|nr:TrkA family potassium uptake protein [Fusobacteriota bacterium]
EPNMIEHMKFSDGHILVELRAPKKFINRSLMELELRKRYHANVIGIKKISGDLVMTPLPDTIIKENDTLMLIANVKTIKELEELE